MFWVHFVRDFYRAGAARPGHSVSEVRRVVAPLSQTAAQHAVGFDADHYPLTPAEFADDVTMHQVQEDVIFLAQRLQSMQQALAVSDRGRSAFLSSMSHELRTPLNAIMGFADMMKSGVFGEIEHPTYRQYVTHIHESGQLLLQKINDLLDIASMDADALTLSEAECDISAMMQELLEIHSHTSFTRQQTIRLDVAEGIAVMADKAKLLCALSHFVSNALRHSPEGADILVRARVQPDDGLILSVHDTGEGIAFQQLSVIREALQADIAYERIECGGIGLGLSLSKELAARHGGRVMIDSMRRRGTVVAMVLPVERVVRGMPARRRGASPVDKVASGAWQLVE